jgi:hypothetical protein
MFKKNLLLVLLLSLFIFVQPAFAQMTFYLIDNFEDGDFTRNPTWFNFDNSVLNIVENQKPEKIDFVAESTGKYSLGISGRAANWYVGGFGIDQSIDASDYSRIQFDLYGNPASSGKLKIELYEDDNSNNQIEQDPKAGWVPTADDKWVAEVNVLGEGFTRYSIPFTAFKDDNPGVGNDKFDPDKKNGSGGLLKIQFIAIAGEQQGEANFRLDNILLTY